MAGKCSQADVSKIQQAGMVKVGIEFAECINAACNEGDHKCVSKCMVDTEMLSDTCGECFGDMAYCPQESCKDECAEGENSSKVACIMCLSMKCAAPFQSCVGGQEEESKQHLHHFAEKAIWAAKGGCMKKMKEGGMKKHHGKH